MFLDMPTRKLELFELLLQMLVSTILLQLVLAVSGVVVLLLLIVGLSLFLLGVVSRCSPPLGCCFLGVILAMPKQL